MSLSPEQKLEITRMKVEIDLIYKGVGIRPKKNDSLKRKLYIAQILKDKQMKHDILESQLTKTRILNSIK